MDADAVVLVVDGAAEAGEVDGNGAEASGGEECWQLPSR